MGYCHLLHSTNEYAGLPSHLHPSKDLYLHNHDHDRHQHILNFGKHMIMKDLQHVREAFLANKEVGFRDMNLYKLEDEFYFIFKNILEEDIKKIKVIMDNKTGNIFESIAFLIVEKFEGKTFQLIDNPAIRELLNDFFEVNNNIKRLELEDKKSSSLTHYWLQEETDINKIIDLLNDMSPYPEFKTGGSEKQYTVGFKVNHHHHPNPISILGEKNHNLKC